MKRKRKKKKKKLARYNITSRNKIICDAKIYSHMIMFSFRLGYELTLITNILTTLLKKRERTDPPQMTLSGQYSKKNLGCKC